MTHGVLKRHESREMSDYAVAPALLCIAYREGSASK
jgi:hypothetical protein